MFYLLVKPEGYSGINVDWRDVPGMGMDEFVYLIEDLSDQRGRENAEYERIRAKMKT